LNFAQESAIDIADAIKGKLFFGGVESGGLTSHD
jgi:hypothetical protein